MGVKRQLKKISFRAENSAQWKMAFKDWYFARFSDSLIAYGETAVLEDKINKKILIDK